MQLLRNRLVATARTSLRKNASLGQLYGNMQEAYHQIQTPLMYQQPSQVCLQLMLLVTILFCPEIKHDRNFGIPRWNQII
jgi:hypothetical protein